MKFDFYAIETQGFYTAEEDAEEALQEVIEEEEN